MIPSLSLHHEKDLLISLWVRTIANCNILTVSQGRLKLRHIGIQCHFFHFTYPKTLKEDNKRFHIYPFAQTDYKQLKKNNPGQTEGRELQDKMTRT